MPMTIARNNHYKSYRGATDISLLINGKRTTMRELGNSTSVELTVGVETEDIYETKTRYKALADTDEKARSVDISITLNELAPSDVALALGGEIIQKGEESVVDEVIPTVADGDRISLDGIRISGLTVTDNDGTVVDAAKYEVDEEFGNIKFNDVSALAQPFKASYTAAANDTTVLFSMPKNALFHLEFKGVDTRSNETVVMQLYKVRFKVDTTMQFINDSIGEITITGSALVDGSKADDPELGPFGKIITVGA